MYTHTYTHTHIHTHTHTHTRTDTHTHASTHAHTNPARIACVHSTAHQLTKSQYLHDINSCCSQDTGMYRSGSPFIVQCIQNIWYSSPLLYDYYVITTSNCDLIWRGGTQHCISDAVSISSCRHIQMQYHVSQETRQRVNIQLHFFAFSIVAGFSINFQIQFYSS